MNKYQEIIDHVVSFNISSILKNNIDLFFKKLSLLDENKIELLEIENISLTYVDEVLFEWMFGNCYVQLRIRENETRCEAKLPGNIRSTKYHPLPQKVINHLIQSLDKILEIK
jgi:hypothetical protein